LARNHRLKDRQTGSPAQYGSIRFFKRLIRHLCRVRASRSSLVPGLHGTPIRWAKRSSVTAGCGWVQREGGPIEEIRPGDVVWFSPGEEHWHGATPTTAMTHVAIQEKRDGKVVDWMEHVSDEQCRK
jgi:hypothetical protein